MNKERGMAVALVLLILAVVSLLGAGLMVQSIMNTRFSSAQKNYDKMFNLADGGATYGYNKIQLMTVASYDTEVIQYPVGNNTLVTVGQWSSSVTIRGYSVNAQDFPGWELGPESGFHVEFWTVEGLGARSAAGAVAQSVVEMAATKIARN